MTDTRNDAPDVLRELGWDEAAMALQALDVALYLPRVPLLATGTLKKSAGAYALFLHHTRGPVHSAYRGAPALLTGQFPIYAGSTDDLRARAHWHAESLRGVERLDPRDFHIATLSSDEVGIARLVERALINAWRPLWNEPWLAGFGSRDPGASRVSHQRITAWDEVHRNRWWWDRETTL